MLTLGSLFDGIGGWQLAAINAGLKPLWSSEIEKFPLAVTRLRFPETVQLGDITQIDGGKIAPVDIICAGSPCQDLSIAGKQEGLKGARSGLFRRAVDIVRQMRFATGGKYPRFFVWENVLGAFSSNRGMDFRAVLEEIGQAKLPMPVNGRWAAAGMVELPSCQIAWRVLDAQYWGVPQRRKRIFLVADIGGRSAGEILFERQSLSGNTQTSGAAGQGVAAGTQNGTDNAVIVINDQGGERISVDKDAVSTLRAETHGHPPLVAYSFDSLGSNSMKSANPHSGCHEVDKAKTLDASSPDPAKNQGGIAVLCGVAVYEFHGQDTRAKGPLKKSPTISAKAGMVAKGPGAVFCEPHKFVRRLTPTECERLQCLPDGWTLIEDKTCSDSARYKALGNGMAQPCADWIIRRIAEYEGNGRD